MGCLMGAAATAGIGAAAAAIIIKPYWIFICVVSFFVRFNPALRACICLCVQIGFTMFLIVSEVIDSAVATYFVWYAHT